MALRSKVRLFPVGRVVYMAQPRYPIHYAPLIGTVVDVEHGRLVIHAHDGANLTFSPNDRCLCLTLQECEYICGLLNEEEAKNG